MKHLSRVVLPALIVSAVACDSETPVPSGRLSTPSGLVYVPREGTRRDLYVADSDAQGVRLLQSETVTDEDGRPQVRRAFVPAPAVYFPLLIPTPGFPTRLAASRDGLRVYALAPTSRTVYVIDGTPMPLVPSPSEVGAEVLLDLVLDGFAEPTWVPVALEVVPGDAMGRDLLLVAFDVLGGAEGRLLGVTLEGTSTGVRLVPGTAATRTIAPGPRAVAVRGQEVILSSAGSSTVSVVSVAGGVLGEVRSVEVGGPTAVVVDAEELGLLAFRLDSSRVEVLLETNGALELVGSLLTHGSPVADAAFGRFESLSPYRGTNTTEQSAAPDVLADLPRGPGGVSLVAVAHADADMSFLIPAPGASPPVRVAEDQPASIRRLSALFGDVSLVECPGATAVCATEMPAVPTCASGVVTRTATGALPLELRVTFQGNLARWRRGAPEEMAPLRLETATTSAAFVRIDGDFAERKVMAGDVVELLLEAPRTCDASAPALDLQGVGTVQGVDSAGLTVSIPVTEANALGGRLLPLVSCPEAVGWFGYEVHPAGREVVIARVDGVEIEAIHRRIPLVDSSTPTVRLQLEPGAPLQLDATLTGDLVCITEDREPASPACFRDEDCGGSARCQGSGTCEGACETQACGEEIRGCLTRERVRRCSTLALTMAPPIPLEYSLSTGSEFVPSAPDQVVFDPLRPGFFVSFPGGREIVDAHAATNTRQLVIDRVR